MRLRTSLLFLAALLLGCAGYDSRFANAPEQIVTVDGLPVSVRVIPADASGTLFDVDAGEGRAIAFTGLNEPLVYQARFRKAAILELQRMFGSSANIKLISESAPPGAIKLFQRYTVQK